ncbi:hypothetical protein [Crateriforma conspicua]|nr:hypothetical protein [Crateriforma conspicua]QDV60925.1 hypothetical protein Mal65_00450 [Crateriforma conspicua]
MFQRFGACARQCFGRPIGSSIFLACVLILQALPVDDSVGQDSPDADSATAPWPDRITCLVPCTEVDHALSETAGAVTSDDPARAVGPTDLASIRQCLNPRAIDAWEAYQQVCRAFQQEPDDPAIARFLGISRPTPSQLRDRGGRGAPSWLDWDRGTYRTYESTHFVIHSQADEASTRSIAIDLERTYWIWTQLFFPLWESRSQVARTFAGMTEPTVADVVQRLRDTQTTLNDSTRMRIVVFADRARYQRALAEAVPGIENSTGFYADGRRTTFLYVDPIDDAATRRHELTHQLFREATDSRLGRTMPGSRGDFWLVEGIAGYVESLQGSSQAATLGGWDSPRLQFARYRVLANVEYLDPESLWKQPVHEVQKRSDLATWYAHAILHTHWLMDPPNDQFAWVLDRLAKLYAIRVPWAKQPQVQPPRQSDLESFLRVDDSHLRRNPTDRAMKQLCLSRCEVTSDGLRSISPQVGLQWLDLSGVFLTSDDLSLLDPNPTSLLQLNLENTAVDEAALPWIGRAVGLTELDLSWTEIDDRLADHLMNHKALQTAWLTGSRVGDEVLRTLESIATLRSIDVQRTRVSDGVLQRFRAARPSVALNPLELRDSPQ